MAWTTLGSVLLAACVAEPSPVRASFRRFIFWVGMPLSGLVKIQDNIFINVGNVSYVELTGKGGADIHFVGKTKLHLKPSEVGLLHRYIHKTRTFAALMKRLEAKPQPRAVDVPSARRDR
jgi:hypothetical protein